MSDCDHRRKRKNYPFGKKARPTIKCKDCGKIITPNELAKERLEKQKAQKRRRNY